MWVVARRALERLIRGTSRDEARALSQTIGVRDDVDVTRRFEKRSVIAQRLRWLVTKGVLPLAENLDRSVDVTLLANVQAPLDVL